MLIATDTYDGASKNRLPYALAMALSEHLGLQVIRCASYQKSGSNTRVSVKTREINEHFFIVDEAEVSGRRVVIVDDVYTSGDTVLSLAAAVKRAGGPPLMVATLASDPSRNSFWNCLTFSAKTRRISDMNEPLYPANYPKASSFDYSDWDAVHRRQKSYGNTLEDSAAVIVECANIYRMHKEGTLPPESFLNPILRARAQELWDARQKEQAKAQEQAKKQA